VAVQPTTQEIGDFGGGGEFRGQPSQPPGLPGGVGGGPLVVVQIIGWTAKNLIAEYRPIIDALVSGFQIGR